MQTPANPCGRRAHFGPDESIGDTPPFSVAFIDCWREPQAQSIAGFPSQILVCHNGRGLPAAKRALRQHAAHRDAIDEPCRKR